MTLVEMAELSRCECWFQRETNTRWYVREQCSIFMIFIRVGILRVKLSIIRWFLSLG